MVGNIIIGMLLVFSGISEHSWDESDVADTVGIEQRLAAIEGADMTMYDLYVDNLDVDRDKAMECAELFLARIDSTVFSRDLARLSGDLAQWYEMEKFLLTRAVDWRLFSLRQYEGISDLHGTAKAEYCLAKLYLKKGLYHKTLKYVNDAYRIFTEEEDEIGRMECYKLLGVVYQACKDYERSEEFFQAYVKSARIVNDSARLFLGLNNSAAFASSVGDTAKTLKLMEESIRLARRTGAVDWLCELYLNIAGVYLNPSGADKAEEYLELARPLLSNIEQEGHYYTILGNLCIVKGDRQGAIESYLSAVDSYSKGEFDSKLRNVYSRLHSVYKESGDLYNAYDALNHLYELEVGLDKEDALIELFRTQNEIEREQAQDLKERQRLRLILISASVLALLISVISVVVFLVRKRAFAVRQKEMEIDKERELAEMRKVQQLRTDRIVGDVIVKLQGLAGEMKTVSSREKINSICNDLRNSKDDEEWKAASQYIPEFNSDFYQKLIRDFPDLSVNESRICVLLNQNMSTKQISAITRQSPDSINVARTRLRKKLGLTGSGLSIQEFLRRYN